ncbi:MAG: MltA domain-containing protein [Candidatus Aerophobetes bacterium]|nr:MltA domain-containing protein [Candidatus Aerophobetes bacterium]
MPPFFNFKSKRFFLITLVGCGLAAEFVILYYFLILVPKKLRVKPPVKPPKKYLVEVREDKIPHFTLLKKDNLEKFKKAFKREEGYLFKKITHERKFPFGRGKLPPSVIKQSAKLLLKTFREAETEEELNRLIKKRFLVYQAIGRKGEGKVLFTGYYTPLYEGSLRKHGPYKHPLYLEPKDLKAAKLEKFDPSLEGEKIFYRIDSSKKEIVPYWSRKDIVEDKVLKGKDLEFVYLKNRIDRFYLMVQGSGKIVLDDGRTFWARYSAKNGRPYTSLGKLLIEEGKIPKDKISIQSIKEYFRHHPHLIDNYLLQNKSFIFFAKSEGKGGAVGAAGCELTPEASIAVDKSIFPLGAIAYIEYPEPEVDKEGVLVGTKKRTRFVFCQDTGGVIKGPGKADIYFGEGGKALAKGGHLKDIGRLYFLIKKGS